MKRLLPLTSIVLFLLCAGALSAPTPGTFRGVLVGKAVDPNWINVQAINGSTRRVEVSKADVVWGDSIPANARSASPKQALKEGTEVRVEAVAQPSGDWEANRVEILNLHATPVQALPRLSDKLPQNVAELR
ncbi:MAG TPA: hypothetical protein VFU76_17160 [Terriglobales bacterium]|nr:hypothetical protein [Terriglobales bacterium]